MATQQGRRLFIEHQRSFRDSVNDQQAIEQEWQRKTTNQKREMRQALERLRDAEQAMRNAIAAKPRVQEDARYIIEHIDNEVRDLPLLNVRMRETMGPYKALHESIVEISSAWQALADLERSQKRTMNQMSIAHAERSAHWRARQASRIGDRIAKFEQELDLADIEIQPVPLDQQGVEVVPEEWIRPGGAPDDYASLYAASKAHHEDLVDEQLRMVDTLQCEWVPWMRCGSLGEDYIEGWLWLQFTVDDNTILDRVWRKDCIVGEDDWRDARKFDGNVKDPKSKVPWELACHDALMDVENLDSIVRLRERLADGGKLVNDAHASYKLYMEYCPHGDLQDIIEDYKRRNARIPEAFIWYVAEALTNCGVAMFRGRIDVGTSPAGWRPIVHRDIKPHNVFLAAPRARIYPSFPKPMLADFGHAFRTFKDDPYNPRWYNHGAGTLGYQAPEQQRLADRKTKKVLSNHPINDLTDVYAIGVTLYCLVALGNFPDQPLWLADGQPQSTLYGMHLPTDANDKRNDEAERRKRQQRVDEGRGEDDESDDWDSDLDDSFMGTEKKQRREHNDHVRSYSNTLRVLIMECLKFLPPQRPNMVRLQTMIQNAVMSSGQESDDESHLVDEVESDSTDSDDRALVTIGRIRNGTADVDMTDGMRLVYREDRYRMGMARAQLPEKSDYAWAE